jgi:hypothetical protein
MCVCMYTTLHVAAQAAIIKCYKMFEVKDPTALISRCPAFRVKGF